MRNFDVVVVGGGPAGMAAAISASETGAKVVIIERDNRLGGILNQCIHNGFGLHYFKVELTGPEYAQRFIDLVAQHDIEVMTQSFAIDIVGKVVTVVSATEGIVEINGKSLVLAMGCRERTAGAIAMPGTRPAGVWTAGMAQRLCNVEGKMVGRKVVILGSGDIGLIMARRMTFEGAEVKMVCELMSYSGGLKRNIVQCLDDYNIPLNYSTTLSRVVGDKRVEGVYIAKVDDKLRPIKETEEFVECDTVLLSVGLIPENDLVSNYGLMMDRVTSGAIVDEYRHTNIEGVFACGNALHVHDLVDNVSNESIIAGNSAALYAQGKLPKGEQFWVKAINGVRYALPHKVTKGEGEVKIFYRVGNIYKSPKVVVTCGDKVLYSKKHLIMAPGEMESVTLNKKDITGDITIQLEGGNVQ